MISASSNESLAFPGPQCRAAMFIDWENVAKAGLESIQACIQQVRQEVTVSVMHAYANWTKNAPGSNFLSSLGAELTHLGGNVAGKNSADMQLTVDACELLLTTSHFDCLVLISGDRDFRPLVSLARKRGLWVWGIGPADGSSDILRTCCDRFLELKNTAAPKPPAVAKVPQKAKTPPKPAAKPVAPAAPLPPIDDEFCQHVAAAFQDALTDSESKTTPVDLCHFFASLRKCAPGFNASQFSGRTNRTHVYSARRLQDAGLIRMIPNSPLRPNVQPTQVILARIQAQPSS